MSLSDLAIPGASMHVPNAHLRLHKLRQATVALIVAAEQDSVADFPSGVDYGFLDRAWEALDATYPVIWTDEQVAAINAWQSCGHTHPLTCANHDDNWHKDEDGDEVLPFAIPQGLVCRACGYRQFWVPEPCLGGAPISPAQADRSPQGEDRNGLHAEHESAVPEGNAPTPSPETTHEL
jgi:hypothetical protein